MQAYFDNCATTKIHPSVFKEMEPYLKDKYGNASCSHSKGLEALYVLNYYRSIISTALDVDLESIIFTSGATESNNTIISNFIGSYCPNILISKLEHPSIINPLQYYSQFHYCNLFFVENDKDGIIDLENLEHLLKMIDFRLVSIMYVNNEIGVIQPIKEIFELCKKHNVTFHTDATQAIGKIQDNLDLKSCDYASISGHKIHGPKGIGALINNIGSKFQPLLFGGGQENGFRSGTENIPGIVGFGEAVIQSTNQVEKYIINKLRDRLVEGLLNIKSKYKIELEFNSSEFSVPNIINFSIPEFNTKTFIECMDEHEIYLSAGSACHSGKPEGSYVISALGKDKKLSESTIRISFSNDNTLDEVDYFLKIFEEYIDNVKNFR